MDDWLESSTVKIVKDLGVSDVFIGKALEELSEGGGKYNNSGRKFELKQV